MTLVSSYRSPSLRRWLLATNASIFALALAPHAFAADPTGPDAAPPPAHDTVTVIGAATDIVQPADVVTKTAEEIADTTHVVNAEDALRYFPNILLRKRHIGDTQAPITTRTSGVGASARSLIYVDGVLISALIGNNNNNASPKWGMVSPEEIASIDVLYGPFSAAYAGNSIGAVVEINTRMPGKLEGTLSATGSSDHFSQYATKDDFGAWQAAGTIGDRFGPVSFWLAATHTDSQSQPLTYVTATRPASPSSAGTVITGAFNDVNRTAAPIVVLGAGGLEDQKQDNLKFKAAWDITPHDTLAYTFGRFANDTSSDVQSYLRNASGATVYSGSGLNINGYSYTVAASAFSNGVYNFDEEQFSNSLAFNHRSADGVFDWRIVASAYDYDTSEQRLPSTALPTAYTGGAGAITRGDGTGWQTLDARGVWRPSGAGDQQEISFGAHGDRYELTSERFNTTDWIDGAPTSLATSSRGKTQTFALWAQDAVTLSPDVAAIVGGRWESWKAYDGYNYALAPALSVRQPQIERTAFSPKGSLEWRFAPEWSVRGSVGAAYRFPTVGELYQAITVGALQTSPNPNLKPEYDVATEVSLARSFEGGNIRLSFFSEDITDALISQTTVIDPASTTPALPAGTVASVSFVQNIDKVESRGIELVGEKENLFIQGLSLQGSITWVDSKTAENAAFPATVGKQTPQVPDWRATLVATYRPDDHWAFTVAGRYVDRTYATIDNIDTVSHTYQGFESFTSLDVRVTYKFDQHWTAALGLENANKADYFLFHPFPQRTATAELKYAF
jgi:iron complex outermembrane receptor protein